MEVSTIMKYSLKYKEFFKKQKDLLARVKSKYHCGDNIPTSYIKKSIKNADILLSVYDKKQNTNDNKSLRGFACLKMLRYKKLIKIDLICRGESSKMELRKPVNVPSAKLMINEIKKLVKNVKYNGIVLDALPNVVKYYEKQGFAITRDTTCKKKTRKIRDAAKHAYVGNFYKNDNLRERLSLSNYRNLKSMKNNMHDVYGITMLWCNK